MSEEKNVNISENPVEVLADETPEQVNTVTAKKTTVSKNISKKTKAKTENTGKKVAGKNRTEKEKTTNTDKPVRTRKKTEPSLDNVTTALWNKFKDVDVTGVQVPIAIQIIVYDLGTFFIAIKEGGEKHIIQAVYNDRDGTMEVSYDEILKMAAGGYDYLKSINDGIVNYQGDLRKAITLANLFNK